MEVYNRCLGAHGCGRPRRCCSCRTTSSTAASTCTRGGRCSRLLELGCVPIVNENDAIASDEIRYGDNDRIAALVAHNLSRRPAGAAHRHRPASTPPTRGIDPRRRADRAWSPADDPLLAVSAGAPRLDAGERRHGVEAVGGADGVVVRRPRGDRLRHHARTCSSTRSPGHDGRHDVHAARPQAVGAQAVDRRSPATSRGRWSSTTVRAARSSSGGRRCCRPVSSRCAATSSSGDVSSVRRPRRRRRRSRDGDVRRAVLRSGRRQADHRAARRRRPRGHPPRRPRRALPDGPTGVRAPSVLCRAMRPPDGAS